MNRYATALRSNDIAKRRTAVKELCQLGATASLSALDSLIELLDDSDELVREGAAEALVNLVRSRAQGRERAVDALVQLLVHGHPRIRMRIVRLAGQIGSHASPLIPMLVDALGKDDVVLGRIAAETLCRVGADAVPALENALTNSNVFVRQNAAWALKRLTGAEYPTDPPASRESSPPRQEVFRAWIAAMENEGMSMLQARKAVADRFQLREGEMKEIEAEGADKNW
jgi:HEAT repeat protein